MEGHSQINIREMFECYVYDHLKRNGLHETAEIFRIEANLSIDPETIPGFNDEFGFLQDWWHIFYPTYQSRNPSIAQHNAASSLANETMNMGRQSAPPPSREHDINEGMIKELAIGSDVGIITGEYLVPSAGSPPIAQSGGKMNNSADAEVEGQGIKLVPYSSSSESSLSVSCPFDGNEEEGEMSSNVESDGSNVPTVEENTDSIGK